MKNYEVVFRVFEDSVMYLFWVVLGGEYFYMNPEMQPLSQERLSIRFATEAAEFDMIEEAKSLAMKHLFERD